MQFEWDAAKAERNRRKHGVTFDEAVSVFADSRELSIFDPDHSLDEDRYVSIGESSAGRLLVVGYTERESKIRIIFARRATWPEGSTMKKRPDDELRNEYDFREGVRGRHQRRLVEGGILVRLDPDVAARFPTSKAVNDALRATVSDEGDQAGRSALSTSSEQQ